MNINLATTSEINEIAKFVTKLNQQKSTHIGYAGTEFDEIVATLEEDFVLENGRLAFVLLKNEIEEIVGAIGLDIDENSAEVWGPFEDSISEKELTTLWQTTLDQFPHVETAHFFVNLENTTQQKFIERLHVKKTGEYLTLTVSKGDFEPLNSQRLFPFQAGDEKDFESLHNELFPNTYYDAKTIVSRINEDNKLLLFKNEQQALQGYAYFEVATVFGEASLEYIAVSPKHQNQGLGTLLLKEVLQEIFKHDTIAEIRLCVENDNDRANHVYMKAGFKMDNILLGYTFNR
ncbi:GNAT family N-acetyltransferase [Solibacillus cecembensis]|uniref:GNAT family N-acetyltransferase n=1 Tax=Solibacillus cecembensis TaxID=459347 RepID=UPI003D0200E3